MILSRFDVYQFMQEYWQQKPCVIRNFVEDFNDPIDEHDLAGLAMEAEIDSRIVTLNKQQWQVNQGPFTSFDKHCVGAWTLLVQSVDRYVDEVNLLTRLVDFIPNWRLDDVMVSFSVPGAGVGPHIDEYDVFIVQGKGKRQWKVGPRGDYESYLPHPLLKQISDFSPIIDEILEPGDAVYIPPHYPHDGTAIDASINYSIGFRAPTGAELLVGMAEELNAESSQAPRFVSTMTTPCSLSAYTDQAALQAMKSLILESLSDPAVDLALLQYMSRQDLPVEPLDSEDAYQAGDLELAYEQHAVVRAVAGLKPLYADYIDQNLHVFIDGTHYQCHSSFKGVLIALTHSNGYSLIETEFDDEAQQQAWQKLLLTLMNQGYYYLSDD